MKPWSTSQFQVCLNRLNEGDPTAREEIIERCLPRVRAICSKMLRGFPDLQGKESTQDICQHAYFRIYRMLEELEILTAKDFLQLCAYHIRFALLDLLKHYQRELASHEEVSLDAKTTQKHLLSSPSFDEEEIRNLERWSFFHEAVDLLPSIEADVVGLIWYEGFSQKEVAEILKISLPSVKRIWTLARLNLSRRLGDDLPII